MANVWTTLPSGTDYQAFCYDEQNQLTWASSASGTVPCGGGTWTAGSLASAGYTHTYTYDTLNRLTSGPGGSYTYGDPHHLDAATAILGGGGGSSSYTASYDAAGDMVCRAPTSSTTCAGQTQTGAQLSYDNERRLATWQNAPTNPTSSTSNLYDGEGHRVEQQVTNGAVSTTITTYGVSARRRATSVKASRAAATVRAMSSSVWASETKPVSNCDGAVYTPRSSSAWK